MRSRKGREVIRMVHVAAWIGWQEGRGKKSFDMEEIVKEINEANDKRKAKSARTWRMKEKKEIRKM